MSALNKHFMSCLDVLQGEDGILSYIFYCIGVFNKTYVEIGTEDGQQCNTRLLREQYKWTGLLLDAGYEDVNINLQKVSMPLPL